MATFPNALQAVAALNNDFFALRHGQSEANVAGIIASDPLTACTRYGLSETGRTQAAEAGQTIVELYHDRRRRRNHNNNNNEYEGLAVITSDLRRARETASAVVQEVAAAVGIPLHKNCAVTDARLRERGFGTWDGGPDANYRVVWEADAADSAHAANGVEPVDSVMRRATECVAEWDALLRNHMIVLVAHGDVLQILQTAFLKLPGSQHRSVEHLETATVRALELK